MRNNLPEGAQPWAKRVSKTLEVNKKAVRRTQFNQRATDAKIAVGGARDAANAARVEELRSTEERLEDLEGSLSGTVEGVDESLTGLVDITDDLQLNIDGINEFNEEVINPFIEDTQEKLNTDLPQALDRANTAASDALEAITISERAEDKADAAVKSVEVQYALSTSRTTAPTTGWTSSQTVPGANQVVWYRSKVTYGDDSVVYTNATLLTGPKGDTGADGLPGAAGKGLASTDVSYVVSPSDTTPPSSGWQSSVPTLVKGRYLWTRTVWTYTDNSTETGYSVSYLAEDGSTGADGLPGKDGVGIKSTTITYAQSTSGTTAPTSGWQASPPSPIAGRYVWTRTIWTYDDNTTETGYSVGKIGDTGAKGEQGVSVVSVTPYYRRVSNEGYDPILRTVPEPIIDTNIPSTEVIDRAGTAVFVGIFDPKNTICQYLLAQTVTSRVFITSSSGTIVDSYWSGSTVSEPPMYGVSGLMDPSVPVLISTRYTGHTPDYEWKGVFRALVFDTELSPEQRTAVIDWLMAGHYLDPPGTPIGIPELPDGNLNGAGRNLLPRFTDPRWDVHMSTEIVDKYTLYTPGSNRHSIIGRIVLEVEPNAAYTITVNSDNGRANLLEWFPDQGVSGASIFPYVTGSFTRTFNVGDTAHVRLTLGRYSQEYGDIKFWNLKLEKGSEATAWTPAPEDDYDYWQKEEPSYKEGTSLYRTELVVYDNGTFQYTPVTLVTSYEVASTALYIGNLAQQQADGLIWTGQEEPPHEARVNGQIWIKTTIVQTDDGPEERMSGIYKLLDPEPVTAVWQTYTMITGLFIVPGADGEQASIIDQNGAVFGTVDANSITGREIKGNSIGTELLAVGAVTQGVLEQGLRDNLTNMFERVVITPTDITISQSAAGSNNLTALQLTASRMTFTVENNPAVYIDSKLNLMSIDNAVIREAIQVGEHQIRRMGSGITNFTWIGNN